MDHFFSVGWISFSALRLLYGSLVELQVDLDAWLVTYNEQRTHQGKMCCGRTPRETFDDGMRLWKERMIGDVA